MAFFSELDSKLCQALCEQPRRFQNRYTSEAKDNLLETLFRALTNDREDYLKQLFPDGFPSSYTLQDAQGVQEEAEYTEAALGHPCGHIFKQGEASYHCMTCTDDPTCVLCAKCFVSSDHEGHQFHISSSAGNSGCCDCGDDEAWSRPVNCAIHTKTDDFEETEQHVSALPQDLQTSVRITIRRVLNYFCDVVSCSPENLRLPKSADTVRSDEQRSRLDAQHYRVSDEIEVNPEFCLIVWNDEKHTVTEVQKQVARACKEREKWGIQRAHEADGIGRSVLKHSRDLDQLLVMAKIIEQIKITVTIRSSRDTFREQMCGTILDWLCDIAGCSIGGDSHILRRVICEEMLQVWHIGSQAVNARVGKSGLFDHEIDENRLLRKRTQAFFADPIQILLQGAANVANIAANDTDGDEEDDDVNQLVGSDEEDEDDADEEMGEMIIETDAMGDPRNLRLIAGLTQAGDPDATDDADEMDTDGDVDFVDAGERIEDTHEGPNAGGSHIESGRAGENANFLNIPRLRGVKSGLEIAPNYWTYLPPGYNALDDNLPVFENLHQNVCIDSMILFDLRLWKQARTTLRDLFISTVVNIPQFKRILGLRFAGLYTTLAQLYLVADREPDHSITNLSLQMLTSQSITEEVVERANFLTKLMAILYTFLTTRQVGFPTEVDPNATLGFDAGSVANRRLYHFFSDLRYFLVSPFVQSRIRGEKQYLLQYLDLAKLSQGICPNIRAIGEHVEYETDAWISASLLTREINKLCRQFAESYQLPSPEVASIEPLREAISQTARTTILNSIGLERSRFEQSEIKEHVHFHNLNLSPIYCARDEQRVVAFEVEKGSLSFHHPLHYTLSWLLELGKDTLAGISALTAAAEACVKAVSETQLPGQNAQLKEELRYKEDALLCMFDFPLRVCAWLAQMKANMWVRNGMSLKHQMTQYKSVAYRDVGHHRDLFMLQTALVVCRPSRVLASILDRFGLTKWLFEDFKPLPDCEEAQMLDLVEDFVYLLINLLSDRDGLVSKNNEPDSQLIAVRKDIAHTLCFKPLSYTDLSARLTERAQEHPQLQRLLDEMAIYRPPEGLNDTGVFELKEEYLAELDPYNSHFTKNQRDEAESVYKKWMSKKTGKAEDDIVLEPKLHPIHSEAYKSLCNVVQQPLFALVVNSCLSYVAKKAPEGNVTTRKDAFLQVLLQLILIATLEDDTTEDGNPNTLSFVRNSFEVGMVSTAHQLWMNDEYSACRSKIRHVLRLFNQKRPENFRHATHHLDFPSGRFDTASPANIEAELEAKKRRSRERNAKIMAQMQQQQQNFMSKQGLSQLDWEGEELDEVESEPYGASTGRQWKFPSGQCIQCREDTNDSRLYGTFAMVCDAHILRQTNVLDRDHVQEVLDVPQRLDVCIDDRRPYGISGRNHTTVKRLSADRRETSQDIQGLGKGWPIGYTQQGPSSTSCGHIMHFTCFQNYYQSVLRRHSQQVARNHPERVSMKEFVCPLCKALANVFLPIVWKSTEQAQSGALQPQTSFEEFVDKVLVSSDLSGSTLISQSQKRVFASFSSNAAVLVARNDSTALKDLTAVYHLLQESLALYGDSDLVPRKFPQVNQADLLLDIVSNSIAATETAYRGRSIAIINVPAQILSHLQSLVATFRAYTAMGAETSNYATTTKQYTDLYKISFSQLTAKDDDQVPTQRKPALDVDSFESFVRYSMLLTPLHEWDAHHLLQVCLIQQFIQVVFAYFTGPESVQIMEDLKLECTTHLNAQELHVAVEAVKFVITVMRRNGVPPWGDQFDVASIAERFAAVAWQLFRSYALALLRKSAVFMHVAHGVDYPSSVTSNADGSELEWLCELMRLPPMTQLVGRLAEYSGSADMKGLALNWIADAAQLFIDNKWHEIRLVHPAPLELIGLPKYFDTLMEESHRRRCPTTGKEITDPALCLFCGEIFCSQTVCCTVDGRGGCNIHMEKCSSPIGMFLFVRKCHVVLLHHGREKRGHIQAAATTNTTSHGSFFPAPYLTKHGEHDSGLRTKQQLILNQKRYDKLLRDTWLMINGSVWSQIARKLEGEVNAGGWETL